MKLAQAEAASHEQQPPELLNTSGPLVNKAQTPKKLNFASCPPVACFPKEAATTQLHTAQLSLRKTKKVTGKQGAAKVRAKRFADQASRDTRNARRRGKRTHENEVGESSREDATDSDASA